MTEFAGQAILHTLVAALVVEALVRLWRIRAPDLRLAFRLLVLAFPVAALPAFFLVSARRQEWFRAEWALFAGSRWEDLALWGVGVDALGLSVLSALGAALFLLDLLPFLGDRLGGRALPRGTTPEGTEAVSQEVEAAAGALGISAPRVRVLETPAVLLLCTGVCRPALVLSRGTLERLDGQERRAAVAHELGHVARSDPLLGWILMAVRAAMFFNPVVQLVARAAVQETERRADDLAVAVTRDPAALAGGLVKLFRAGTGSGGRERSVPRPLRAVSPSHARTAAVEERCRRLLDREPFSPEIFGRLRLVLTGLALLLLLFFVV